MKEFTLYETFKMYGASNRLLNILRVSELEWNDDKYYRSENTFLKFRNAGRTSSDEFKKILRKIDENKEGSSHREYLTPLKKFNSGSPIFICNCCRCTLEDKADIFCEECSIFMESYTLCSEQIKISERKLKNYANQQVIEELHELDVLLSKDRRVDKNSFGAITKRIEERIKRLTKYPLTINREIENLKRNKKFKKTKRR
jgi:DNA-directed RNA polymerase alpha subunit